MTPTTPTTPTRPTCPNAPAGRTRSRSVQLGVATLAVVPALVLAGCGGSDGAKKTASASPAPSPSLPTGDVKVPGGVDLTAPGTKLTFGKPALVAYEANQQKASVLSMEVDSVTTGTISDFSAYQLDARTKKSRPYYVRAKVENAGTGSLGGAAVPLLAVAGDNSLIQPSTFSNDFKRCPSTGLPKSFGQGAKASICLVYLVPDGGTMTAVSYRPLQAFEPITWTGTIKPADAPAKKKKGKGGKG